MFSRIVHILLLGPSSLTNPSRVKSRNRDWLVSLISSIRLELTFDCTG